MNVATIIDGQPDDAAALWAGPNRATYAQLRESVGGMRGALTGLGVGPGDRVAIISANDPTFVIAYLGIVGAGAVAVPLNPLSPPAEVEREVATAGARAAVVGPGGQRAVAGIDRQRAGLEHVVSPISLGVDRSEPLDDLLASAPTPAVDRAPSDLAVLAFTSGTAGSPKAAMLTHGNLLANQAQMQRHPGRAVRSDDVSLGVLPLFHIFGLNVVLGLSLAAGGSVALLDGFDPAGSLQAIEERAVTLVAGAPPMFRAWAYLPDADPHAFDSVRLAVSGAAPLPDEVAAAFEGRYRTTLWQGYGLTEASPTVTSSVIGGVAKRGSIGVPLPGVDVRLVDEEGQDALVGDAGEIWVRGDNVFGGYWEDAAATSAALTPDGWLRTGDIAVVDDDGYLFIVDRAKDLIIVSGFNVYPAEVEDALREHPDLSEAAVVGEPDPATGERVHAYVVARPGAAVGDREVGEFCSARLARYKCPTTVTFVDELPRSLAGKLLRRELG